MTDTRGDICKIISKMLDNPDEHGIYPTTECYDAFEAYIKQARLSTLQECREIADDKELAEQIMKAFYRREHHAEPDEKDVAYLTARMMTALCLMSSKFQSLIDKEVE